MAESVKEHPIIFSGPMVRATLEGRKTQTRRVIKSPYKDDHGKPSKGPFKWVETPEGFSACLDLSGDGYDENGDQMSFCCPYGVPGYRLWVRETFCDEYTLCPGVKFSDGPCYKATDDGDCGNPLNKWRPSIHTPRCASRITMEITGVRAERLQDISEEDALAEGIPMTESPGYYGSLPGFVSLWDSLAKPGAKWSDNPWVWVIEFRRMENA